MSNRALAWFGVYAVTIFAGALVWEFMSKLSSDALAVLVGASCLGLPSVAMLSAALYAQGRQQEQRDRNQYNRDMARIIMEQRRMLQDDGAVRVIDGELMRYRQETADVEDW